MTRRNAGEGNVRQRPNGTWEARYRASDGRRRSVYGRTKREASDRLRAALRAADAGIRPVDQRLSTGAYLEDWLAHHINVRPRTADSYAHTVRS
jgi:integrase